MDNAEQREIANLAAILANMHKAYSWGGLLPTNMLILDIETLGFTPVFDKVVQIGMCVITKGEIDTRLSDTGYTSMMLKWPEECFDGKDGAINVHGIDFIKSSSEGNDPVESFKLLADTIKWAMDSGMYIGGHNFYKFDKPFIERSAADLGVDITFNGDDIIDTGMIVKAMQLGMLPSSDEPISAYWKRVANMRAKGVYFNLDRYCMSRFGLTEKYGVSKDEAHDAGYDCYLTHLVIKELNILLAESMKGQQ